MSRPPGNPQPPDPGPLVWVFTAATAPQGLLLKGLLEAEGIPVMAKGEASGPYRVGPFELWVPERFEIQARMLIEDTGGAEALVDDPDE